VSVSDTTAEHDGLGYSSLTRRERLERIANAERDRRAGRAALAIATIGEPVEWPARAVVALARLSQSEDETRRLLEEGLDLWAHETGLGELNESLAMIEEPIADESNPETDPLGLIPELDANAPDLEAPLDSSELDRAFAEAEAEVDSMHGVNDVAERVLMDERVGFAELAGDELAPVDAPDVSHAFDVEAPPDTLGMDAASVEPEVEPDVEPEVEPDVEPHVVPNVWAGHDPAQIDSKRQVALATLETWLQNLERRKAGRAS
jgi:hypothetical protein